MELTDFEGRKYGPAEWHVAVDAVSDFVDVTGDDPQRWSAYAPPGFAAAALFAVAPELLAELYDRSVIHGEQSFSWFAPIPLASTLEATGSVTRVRERRGVHFITFEMEVVDGPDVVLTGKALFLVGGESSMSTEQAEPEAAAKGEPSADQASASRADLVRYAAATRDWNPVHWDHAAGVAAGFPGVVVHGLLQAGWALRAASEGSMSSQPLASARIRFRNPLRPARPVKVAAVPSEGSVDVVIADHSAEYVTAQVTLSDE